MCCCKSSLSTAQAECRRYTRDDCKWQAARWANSRMQPVKIAAFYQYGMTHGRRLKQTQRMARPSIDILRWLLMIPFKD